MKKIQLIIVYFGALPNWFDAFLLSCKYNTKINWLIFTDTKLPTAYPSNVQFVPMSVKEFDLLAADKLKLKVEVRSPIKLCDFRPMYGVIFEKYNKGFDYWGHCDLDIIWGDIYKFIPNQYFEIFSTRENALAGHFTIYKNTDKINTLYRKYTKFFASNLEYKDEGNHNYPQKIGWKEIIRSNIHCAFDERIIALYRQLDLRMELRWGYNFPSSVIEQRMEFLRMPASYISDLDGDWIWSKGKLFYHNHEIMYLHFMNQKQAFDNLFFNYEDNPNSFGINFAGVSSLENQVQDTFCK